MKIGISVVICCFNSSERLFQTLFDLSKQNLGYIKAELIIVDNNSTDQTSLFAKETWSKLGEPFPFRETKEEKLGLSYARKKGVDFANFEFVVFCDDDNHLNNSYLQIIYELLIKENKVAALGGYGLPITSGVLPSWFEEYQGGYAVGKPNYGSGMLPKGEYLTGAGLAVRKSIFIKAFSLFPSLLKDRSGEELSSGGDTEICLRFLLMGHQIYFDERLSFEHYIPTKRLEVDYREKLFLSFKTISYIIDQYKLVLDSINWSMTEKFFRILKCALRIPLSRFSIIRRWNYQRDSNEFYLLTKFQFSGVTKEIILISSLLNMRTNGS